MKAPKTTFEDAVLAIKMHLGIDLDDCTRSMRDNVLDTLEAAYALRYLPSETGDRWTDLASRVAGPVRNDLKPQGREPMAVDFPVTPRPFNLTSHFEGAVAAYDPRCPWLFTPLAIVRQELALAHGFVGPDNVLCDLIDEGQPFMAVRSAAGAPLQIIHVPWDEGLVRHFRREPSGVVPLGGHRLTDGGIGGLLPSELFASPCHCEYTPEAGWYRWGVHDGTCSHNLHAPQTWGDAFLAYPDARFALDDAPDMGASNIIVFDSVNPIAVIRGAYDRIDRGTFDDQEWYMYWGNRHATWLEGVDCASDPGQLYTQWVKSCEECAETLEATAVEDR